MTYDLVKLRNILFVAAINVNHCLTPPPINYAGIQTNMGNRSRFLKA
jgi:hypothetical protein